MTLNKRIKLMEQYLNDGWSTSMASKKAGIMPNEFLQLVKLREDVAEMNKTYKSKLRSGKIPWQHNIKPNKVTSLC